MKLHYPFAILAFLSGNLAIAQSATTTERPNRRQELYDEYHGIKRKPIRTNVVPAPAATLPKTSDVSPQPQSPPPVVRAAETAENQESTRTQVTDLTRRGLRIGFRGGITYPVFTDNRPYSTPQVGFAGGVTLNLGQGAISFQPEINYARYNVKNNLGFGSSTFASDNVEVPLFLKIATGTYAGSRFFLNVGPYASYTTSASIDGKKVDVSRTKGRFGFGAAAGIGAALRTGPGHITIEVRSLYPLGSTSSDFGTNTNTILGQATLGYVFLLGSRRGL